MGLRRLGGYAVEPGALVNRFSRDSGDQNCLDFMEPSLHGGEYISVRITEHGCSMLYGWLTHTHMEYPWQRGNLFTYAPAEKSVKESTWGEGSRLSYAFPADSFWRGHAKVSGKLPYLFLAQPINFQVFEDLVIGHA
jgi:hypothetical protein